MRPATKLLLLMANRLPTAYSTAWANTAGWTGAGLSVSVGNAIITPEQGAELLTDGGLETWASATDLTNWMETVAGTSSINREATVKHGGSFAARFDIDSSINNAQIAQTPTLANGTWALLSAWTRSNIAGASLRLSLGAVTGANLGGGTSYEQVFQSFRAVANNPSVFFVRGSGSQSRSIYIDDVSAKALTLSTLYAYRNMQYAAGSISAPITLVGGTHAGLVLVKDANNILLLTLNTIVTGAQLILGQCIAGTWSNISTVAATYSAGATLKLSIPGGNVASGIYNGTTLINGAAINAAFATATNWGIFSTYSGNTIGALSWSTTP